MIKEELIKIKGGAAITASMLNAIARTIESIYSLGRALGTGIRMLVSGSRC